MPKYENPAADAIIDKEYKVLDKGFVRLVDYLGGDSRIVQAARVSYGEGTKTIREDKGLIDYLVRHQHTSPLEMVSLTFHCKMPIFVARQWVRHRTAKLNEISGRYSVMKNEFYVPQASSVSLQSTDNKQGRGQTADQAAKDKFFQLLEEDQNQVYEHYEEVVELGIARELARINLPLSLYTEWYWTMDLHNLFHFLALRLDPHAQMEIRVYAEAMLEIVRQVAPLASESFENHIRGAVKFGHKEWEALKSLGLSADSLKKAGEAQGLEGKALERFLAKILDGTVL
ncbi:MAG: FAD-dependent thymidylate synthase [Spirochaetes bacterium GWB1_48_6]|nr:MAG: FAD-dependent thymidylate synthase [Spirochaetes bacterium GWB1_48_6]